MRLTAALLRLPGAAPGRLGPLLQRRDDALGESTLGASVKPNADRETADLRARTPCDDIAEADRAHRASAMRQRRGRHGPSLERDGEPYGVRGPRVREWPDRRGEINDVLGDLARVVRTGACGTARHARRRHARAEASCNFFSDNARPA